MAVTIKGIESEIQAMLFDMDGVIWKSNTPTGDLQSFFTALDKANLKFGFITNNGTKTIDFVQQRLASFNVHCEKEYILNSAIATAAMLKEHFPAGGNIYVVGEAGLIATLNEAGFHHQENPGNNILAVIGGLDRDINYEKLSTAARLIHNGALFFGSNGDKTFPTPFGQVPGAGTMLAAIAAASGSEPIVAGKPEPFLFNLMLKRMNLKSENTLVIGDRLETDILGGLNAGCNTMLVLSGISKLEDINELNIHPHIVRNDIFELLQEI